VRRVTEGRKIAALAEAQAAGPARLHRPGYPDGRPAPRHACTDGHFSRVVRATLASWYRDLVTELPVLLNGMIQAPAGAGLGTALRAEVRGRENAVVRESGLP